MALLSSSVRTARAAGFAALSVLSLSTSGALASPTFPSVVKHELGMPCTPDCSICHTDSPGTSAATATQPFAIQVLNPTCLEGQVFPNCRGVPQGVKAGDTESLVRELTRVKTMMTDSDLDTLSDVVELTGTGGFPSSAEQLTTNPNVVDTATVASASICSTDPVYGCGAAHVTPRAHVHTDLLLLGLATLAVGAGLWRRLGTRRMG